MRKLLLIIFFLYSCNKRVITDGYYKSGYGWLKVVKDSIYFKSTHGIGQAMWNPGIYKIKGNNLNVSLDMGDSIETKWKLKWDNKEKAWTIGCGDLKSVYYRLTDN